MPTTNTQTAVIRDAEEVRRTPVVVLYEGREDGIETSFYDTRFEPGDGPRLHKHPYPEVFLVDEGIARFQAGDKVHDVRPGHFVVVPAETPHRYENAGGGALRVLSVHPSGEVVQTNL